MTIKMIAVDMDGTFLNSKKEYDRERFRLIYQKLKERHIRFVVASGNQYYQLRSFFPDIAEEIAFVAENGAYVINEGKEVFCGEIEKETVLKTLHALHAINNGHTILCGKHSAYVAKHEPDTFVERGSLYFHRLQKVANLFDIPDDTFFKFSLYFPSGDIDAILRQLRDAVDDCLVPVSCGYDDVDLIISGVHKASGLKRLQTIWNIKPEEIVTFGDSGNDIEMLAHAGYSYAMANAHPHVKQIAKETILSNEESGVLQQIEILLSR